MGIKVPIVFFLSFLCIQVSFTLSKECRLEEKCRTVDNSRDATWLATPGHHGTIQECVDHAKEGETCMIAPGTYHEQVKIIGKKDLTITADPEKEVFVMTYEKEYLL